MPRLSRNPARLLPRLLCLALALPALAAAGPSVEYGPEAEARFLVECAGPDVMAGGAAQCRRAMERLQAELGYEAFLERISDRQGMAALAEGAAPGPARRLAAVAR